jgi:transcriptional regulator with XRE-family HTH domain
MAKRDPEVEPMNEEPVQETVPTVGERLRVAREEKGLSLEDVAAQTRIPQRHLASIEGGNWDSLPAPTYTVGFAKSYASTVGLDRNEIGNDLREEMGGQRFAATSSDVFEADPAGPCKIPGAGRDPRGRSAHRADELAQQPFAQ